MTFQKRKAAVKAEELLKRPDVPDHVKKEIRQQSKTERKKEEKKVPFKQRFKEYFKPMTVDEAEEDERIRAAARQREPEEDAGEEPRRSLAHSRMGRDIQKFRQLTSGALEKHAKWVEEGNKKYQESSGGEKKSRLVKRPNLGDTPRLAGYPGSMEEPSLGGMDIDEGMLDDLITGGGGGGGSGGRSLRSSQRSRSFAGGGGSGDLHRTIGFEGGSTGALHKTMGFEGRDPMSMNDEVMDILGYGGGSGRRGRRR